MNEKLAVALLFLCGIIICMVAIALGIWGGEPTTLESINAKADAPVMTGMVVDHSFAPAYIAQDPKSPTGKTWIGAQWQITLRNKSGNENKWNVSETEFRAVQLGQEFQMGEPLPVDPHVGIAVD